MSVRNTLAYCAKEIDGNDGKKDNHICLWYRFICYHDFQCNDTQTNDIQHCNNMHNLEKLYAECHNQAILLSVTILSVIMPGVVAPFV